MAGWKDDTAPKLWLLRFLMCSAGLIGAAIVMCLALALYLLPVGLAIDGQVPLVRWWMPPLVPLTMGAGVLVWLALSTTQWWPGRLAPWRFTAATMWLDKCCVDQSNIAGFLEGGLERFLLR